MLSLKYFTTEHFQCPFVYFLNYLFILYCWLLLILFDPSTHPSFFFCLSGCCGRRLSTVLQFLLEDPEVFIGRILGLSLSFLLGVHVFKILLRATSRRHTGRDATFLTQRCRNPSRYLSSSPFLAGSSCLWLDLQSYSFNHYPHPIIKLGSIVLLWMPIHQSTFLTRKRDPQIFEYPRSRQILSPNPEEAILVIKTSY